MILFRRGSQPRPSTTLPTLFLLRLFDYCHGAFLALVGLQNFLAEAERFRRDLDEFVVGDELNCLFQVQRLEWNEANSFVGGGGAHVGQLLFADGVDVEVGVFGVFADDHAFVEIDAGAYEKFSALLQAPKGIRRGGTRTVSDERSGQTMGNFALPFGVSVEKRVHDDGATCVGQELAAKADEAPAGNAELDADASVAVIVHVGDFAFAGAQLLHDYTHEFFGNVDGEVLDRFHQLAGFVVALGDDLGLADHEFVALAAHHLYEDAELK